MSDDITRLLDELMRLSVEEADLTRARSDVQRRLIEVLRAARASHVEFAKLARARLRALGRPTEIDTVLRERDALTKRLSRGHRTAGPTDRQRQPVRIHGGSVRWTRKEPRNARTS